MRAALAVARAGFFAALLLLVPLVPLVPCLLPAPFGPLGALAPAALAALAVPAAPADEAAPVGSEAGLEVSAFVLPLPAPDAVELPAIATATPVPAPAPAAPTPTSIATPIPATPTPLPLREAPFEIPGMLPFAPALPPFDVRARHEMALDALTYFVRQQGHFPGHSVFQLPAPVWLTRQGLEEEADPDAPPPNERFWELRVPASLPVYLLAAADASGGLDPEATTVTVDGEAVGALERYAHYGVPAIAGGQMTALDVLDLVFAPPVAGRHRIEVRTTPRTGPPTLAVYSLIVAEPDALGARLLRAANGTLYAVLGAERMRIPDDQTLPVLGYGPGDVLPAAAESLAVMPEGEPVSALRPGMLVRAPGTGTIFRLDAGHRVRLRGLAASRALEIHGPVLNAIPPVLEEDMVVQGGKDVFLVERGQLRKVPDWVWLLMRGYRPDDGIRVPERILATLPQNSPQWTLPGGAFHDVTFDSPVLGRTMPYRVYLPRSYDTPEGAGRRYPVVYLLHGMGGRWDEWTGYGVEEVANQLFATDELPELILILPQGGLGYWMDQDGPGATPWTQYVVRDLVPHVDATYRTLARREARAVGGLSMGAHGAITLALTYPEVFGVAGAHSPSIRARASAPAYFGADDAAFARRDPLALARSVELETPPRIWIDAGADDPWRPGAEALRDALEARGWAPEYHVYPGEHDGWYWGDHLWEYLPFYGQALSPE
jgi:enterochelin esterase-like enzyme